MLHRLEPREALIEIRHDRPERGLDIDRRQAGGSAAGAGGRGRRKAPPGRYLLQAINEPATIAVRDVCVFHKRKFYSGPDSISS